MLNSKNTSLHHHTHRQRVQTRRGLIKLIKDDITFTNINILKAINTHNKELQLIKIHIGKTKYITVANTLSTKRHNVTTLQHRHRIRHVSNIQDSILTGDVNAHSTLWYLHTDDHRGQLISNIISYSEHIILNTDTPTRVRHTTLQQATSPDITTLYNRTTWHTIHALNSDHLPIITTINTRTKYKLQQNRHTFINYRKANLILRLLSLIFNHHQTYTLQTGA